MAKLTKYEWIDAFAEYFHIHTMMPLSECTSIAEQVCPAYMVDGYGPLAAVLEELSHWQD